MVRPDFDFLRANRQAFAATWLGHATVLVQIGGVNVLADPVFSDRASPFEWIGPKRVVPLGFSVEELPRIDVVVISHNHYDHLDRASVLALNAQPGGSPLFLVPLGLKAWMADIGVTNVRELDWFDTTASSGFVAHFVPAHHWSKRTLWDRNADALGRLGAGSGRQALLPRGRHRLLARFRRDRPALRAHRPRPPFPSAAMRRAGSWRKRTSIPMRR